MTKVTQQIRSSPAAALNVLMYIWRVTWRHRQLSPRTTHHQ